MSRLTSDQVSGQVLDHLGLVAATIDTHGLISEIDKRLPVSKNKGAKVTMGQRVAAMILNGLGFVNDRLYMFPDFLENKPVDRLLGKGLCAADFNDDAQGRCLDAIYAYGTTKLISELSFEVGRSCGLLGKSVHIDTTTLSVYGDYKDANEEGLLPTYGYSKQKRMDLKQVVLSLATSGSANLPIWMASHDGNASDKKTLKQTAQRIKTFCQQLEGAPSFIYVADSAMYESCVQDGSKLSWLSRVPERLTKAKALVQKPEQEITWQELENNYRIFSQPSQYKGVDQRWLLVYSPKAYERESKTLDRRIQKEWEAQKKALWRLSKQTFQCEADANLALTSFKKKLKYHQAELSIKPIWGHKGKGRPKKGVKPTMIGFQMSGTLKADTPAIESIRQSKGRFILATNVSQQELSDADMLSEYKAQSKIETGFKFIKDDTFELDSIFLKNPQRIEALMGVMTLCLMVYNLAQHRLRETLKAKNETVLNQLKKPTQNPTMAWIFRQFHGVQLWCINRGKSMEKLVVNVKEHLAKIVRLFGEKAMEIYAVAPKKLKP